MAVFNDVKLELSLWCNNPGVWCDSRFWCNEISIFTDVLEISTKFTDVLEISTKFTDVNGI